jgi:hypothetical protein
MSEWTKVVTDPLGLAGFALFLVFGLLAQLKRREERQWVARLAAGMAIVTLAGGMVLAYLKTARPAVSPQSSSAPVLPQQQINQVQQTTTGPGSPAVQGVQGDVTITVDQSSGKTVTKTPPAKRPSEKKPQ